MNSEAELGFPAFHIEIFSWSLRLCVEPASLRPSRHFFCWLHLVTLRQKDGSVPLDWRSFSNLEIPERNFGMHSFTKHPMFGHVESLMIVLKIFMSAQENLAIPLEPNIVAA